MHSTYFECRTVRTCHSMVMELKRKGGSSVFYMSILVDGTTVFGMGRSSGVLFVGVEKW